MVTSEGLTTTALHTVIIQTSRLKELAAFYGEGLGLGDPAPTGGDHLGFALPNVYFGFDLVEKPPKPTGIISLWFEVDNIDKAVGEFEKMGAGIKYPPTQKPWGAVLAALYDPDGNLFGLTERGP